MEKEHNVTEMTEYYTMEAIRIFSCDRDVIEKQYHIPASRSLAELNWLLRKNYPEAETFVFYLRRGIEKSGKIDNIDWANDETYNRITEVYRKETDDRKWDCHNLLAKIDGGERRNIYRKSLINVAVVFGFEPVELLKALNLFDGHSIDFHNLKEWLSYYFLTARNEMPYRKEQYTFRRLKDIENECRKLFLKTEVACEMHVENGGDYTRASRNILCRENDNEKEKKAIIEFVEQHISDMYDSVNNRKAARATHRSITAADGFVTIHMDLNAIVYAELYNNTPLKKYADIYSYNSDWVGELYDLLPDFYTRCSSYGVKNSKDEIRALRFGEDALERSRYSNFVKVIENKISGKKISMEVDRKYVLFASFLLLLALAGNVNDLLKTDRSKDQISITRAKRELSDNLRCEETGSFKIQKAIRAQMLDDTLWDWLVNYGEDYGVSDVYQIVRKFFSCILESFDMFPLYMPNEFDRMIVACCLCEGFHTHPIEIFNVVCSYLLNDMV